MAYKFQVGPASMSGSLKQSGSMSVLNGSGVTKFSVNKDTGNISGSGNLQIGGTADFDKALNCDQSITGLSITDGTATLSAGALTGVTNITLNGVLTDGNYTFDTNGNVSSLGTVGCGAITSTGTVTAVGSFIIGSADLNEADMEKLDGITNGTAAASKAVVLDASKNIATLGTVGCGAITSTGASSLGATTLASLTNTAGATFGGGYGSTGATISTAGVGQFNGALTSDGNVAGTTLTGSTAVRTGGGDAWGFSSAGVAKYAATTVTSLAATTLSASSTLSLDGAAIMRSTLNVSGAFEASSAVVVFNGVAAAAVNNDDLFVALDATTKDMIIRTRTNVVSDMAGTTANSALAAASGVLTLDIANVTAAAIASTDTLLFNDQNGDVVRQSTIDDIAALFSGDGLSATAAVMRLDLNELGTTDMDPAADFLAFVDESDGTNASKKVLWSDFCDDFAGTGITNSSGVLSVDVTGGDSMSRVAIAHGGTLVPGLNYFAAITANAVVTLPASPGLGDIIVLKAHTITDGESITINRAGSQTIDGLTSLELRSEYGAVTLIAAALNDWRIA